MTQTAASIRGLASNSSGLSRNLNNLRRDEWITRLKLAAIALTCVFIATKPKAAGLFVGLVVAASVTIRWSIARLADVSSAAAFGLAWLTLPATVPDGVTISSTTIFFTDLLFPVAAVACVAAYGLPFRTSRFLWLYAAGLVPPVIVGALNGNPELLNEIRCATFIVCACIVAATMYREKSQDLLLKFLLAVIAPSALQVLIEATTGVKFIRGRVTEASAATTTGTDALLSVTRFQLTTIGIAGVVVAWFFAAGLSGVRTRKATIIPLLASSLTLVVFAFSRNQLVIVAIASSIALMLRFRVRSLIRLVVALVVSFGSLLGFATAFGDTAAGRFAPAQLSAYQTRVIGGLSADKRRADSSVYLRNKETDLAMAAWRSSPVFGLGLGAIYRPPITNSFDPFWRSTGRTFLHNGYWWYLTKSGLVGFAGFCYFVLAPTTSAFRKRTSVGIAFLACTGGVLVASWVAPFPWEKSTAPVFGALVGLMAIEGGMGRLSRRAEGNNLVSLQP